ncbi:MAG: UvrD-helicase domain-containing protein [Bacteroidia bacterium]|nr:UvrD-helicase domain-containing protein [Bacteroidia bacterium]
MNLKIYKASAGSGKTFMLAREYLRLVISNPLIYRNILAVTFTNKATDEMKERILEELYLLSSDKKSDHLCFLISECKLTEENVRKNAKRAFNLILHDYSNFSVSTIDSFFQKIFRAFLYELDIKFNFDLLLNDNEVLDEAVKQMVESLEPNQPVTDWLMQLIDNKIEDGKSYRIESDLAKSGKEIFRERFSEYQNELFSKITDKTFLNKYRADLKAIKSEYISKIKQIAQKAVSEIEKNGFDVSDFNLGSRGFANYIYKLSKITEDTKFENIQTASAEKYFVIINGDGKWYSGSTKRKDEVESFCETTLKHLLAEVLNYVDNNKQSFNSANLILKNLYNLGLLSEIASEAKSYTTKNGYFLLAEIPKFLSDIIGNDGASFVYEKSGNRFSHYMIDEFQDTSQMQYKNFLPLIENSLAQGYDNLIVGDVKQSIYRWRNSDWQLLSQSLQNDLKQFNPELITLGENYRSKPNIIAFNNSLYSVLPKLAASAIDEENEKLRIENLYTDHLQATPAKDFANDGFVKVSFFEKDIFYDKVYGEWLPQTVFNLWNRGVKDIAVLVRENRSIPEVFSTLFNFKNEVGVHPCSDFRIVSGESLSLTASGVVNFLVSLIRYTVNSNDRINIGLLLNEYNVYLKHNAENPETWFGNGIKEIENLIPELKNPEFVKAVNLSFYEMVEQFISIFNLYSIVEEIPFILNFLDCVRDFSKKPLASIDKFIEWWSENGDKQLVSMSDEKEVVKIVSIHKSKGMQYEAVVIPFPDWAMLPSKHPPVLWCKCSKEPYNGLPVIPVQFNKDMQHSLFAAEYYEEVIRSVIDNANLLYVATTRAKTILEIACPVNKKEGQIDINKLILDSLNSDTDCNIKGKANKFNSFLNKETQIFEIGNLDDIKPVAAEAAKKQAIATSGNYSVFNTEILVADNSFGTMNAEVDEKIKYGILLHEILAQIKYKDEALKVLSRFCTKEKITKQEQKQLGIMLTELFKIPEAGEWFDEKNEVMTEIGIVVKGKGIQRPDRVVQRDNKIIVIDYKTGKEDTQKHKSQVNRYVNLIKEMNYTNVEGWLLYTDLIKVEKV